MIQNKIKVSDYVVKFIEKLGVNHIFLISGGGNIHLIDSVGKSKKIKYICNHHEQASAIAAEAYSRITGNIGVCLVTTGPGATNAITGVAGGWLDSIPMLIISGQMRRDLMGAGKDLRQLGDQEINIVDIVKPITKYAVTVMDPLDIKYHLEKAVYLAKEGRPGPVWIDIPLDVQGSYVDEKKLKTFDPKEIKVDYETDKKKLKKLVSIVIEKLKKSERPVLYIGNGVRLAHASKELLDLIRMMKIPVLTAFAGYDLVSTDNPYYMGRPGTLGQRTGNFVIQNSDLLLSIGTRMNIRAIGYNFKAYARKAFKIIVDIDKKELNKKTIKPDLSINYDAKGFINEMIRQLKKDPINLVIEKWIKKCLEWRKKFPNVFPHYWKEKKVNSYCFLSSLSKNIKSNDVLAFSDGTACVCTYQALEFPQGARIVVNSGCASMGYGLPAAVGACFANNRKSTICLEGDGSIQLNIQELQTIVHHNLPIKIFVFINDAYLSIQITQANLFKGRFVASNSQSGVTCPDFSKIAKAYGIKSVRINNHEELFKIKEILSYQGPVLCEIMVSSEHTFIPKGATKKLPNGSFVSAPLEDMWPFLDKRELEKEMIIELLDE